MANIIYLASGKHYIYLGKWRTLYETATFDFRYSSLISLISDHFQEAIGSHKSPQCTVVYVLLLCCCCAGLFRIWIAPSPACHIAVRQQSISGPQQLKGASVSEIQVHGRAALRFLILVTSNRQFQEVGLSCTELQVPSRRAML